MFQEYKDDRILIRDIRQRENKAFEYIRHKCYHLVRKMLQKQPGVKEGLDDVYNENLLQLIEAIDQPKFQVTKSVIPLFISICRNNMIDAAKKSRSSDKYLLSLSDTAFEEEFDARIDEEMYQNIYNESFNKLDNQCKRILNEFMNGTGLKEIAKAMGLSPSYVKKRKHLCQKSLQDYVQGNPEYMQIRNESDETKY